MAIKGKKKQQGHVRRRPAAAPRAPAIVRRPPWYRTDRGRIAIGIAVVAVVGVAWWVIADARAEAVALQRRQAALEDYTNGARALLQTVRPAAEGMARAPTDPSAPGVDTLDRAARSWTRVLATARRETGQPVADSAVNANRLFAEAVTIYMDAARTFALVPDAGAALKPSLLERAAAQRDDAGVVWLSATQVLDRERAQVELGISQIAAPAAPPPGGNPSVQGGAGQGGGNGGGSDSGNDGGGG